MPVVRRDHYIYLDPVDDRWRIIWQGQLLTSSFKDKDTAERRLMALVVLEPKLKPTDVETRQ